MLPEREAGIAIERVLREVLTDCPGCDGGHGGDGGDDSNPAPDFKKLPFEQSRKCRALFVGKY